MVHTLRDTLQHLVASAKGGYKFREGYKAKNFVGAELALFISQAVQECQRCSVLWSIENPATSRLFTFPPVARLAGLRNARWVQWDMCMYKSDHRKRTLLLTNTPGLDRLGCDPVCNHAHRHAPLAGTCRVVDDDVRTLGEPDDSGRRLPGETLRRLGVSGGVCCARRLVLKFRAAAEHGTRRSRPKPRHAAPRLDRRLDVSKADVDEACTFADRYLAKQTPACGNTSASEVRKIEAVRNALPRRLC